MPRTLPTSFRPWTGKAGCWRRLPGCAGPVVRREGGRRVTASVRSAPRRQAHGPGTVLDRAGDAVGDRLHLPEHSWSNDPERRTAAGIPETVQFATKPRLAEQMIQAALDAGITASWVTGDEAYGQDPSSAPPSRRAASAMSWPSPARHG
ncbi:transposase [Streptomyces sp. CA-142005]|uniref:transposase n=1 Tax=Streptomyces sp. CA-142005 TaxID=3240052 RepID=UPI003D8AEF96